jgi:hypothetical protein
MHDRTGQVWLLYTLTNAETVALIIGEGSNVGIGIWHPVIFLHNGRSSSLFESDSLSFENSTQNKRIL